MSGRPNSKPLPTRSQNPSDCFLVFCFRGYIHSRKLVDATATTAPRLERGQMSVLTGSASQRVSSGFGLSCSRPDHRGLQCVLQCCKMEEAGKTPWRVLGLGRHSFMLHTLFQICITPHCISQSLEVGSFLYQSLACDKALERVLSWVLRRAPRRVLRRVLGHVF